MNYQTVTPIRMAQGALTTTAVSFYQVPSNSKAILKNIVVTNTTAGALLLKVFVSTSTTPPNTDAILFDVSVSPGTPFQWAGSVAMEASERLLASASAAGLNIRASGGEAV